MTRVLADPPSRSGHILTKRELDAALRVLAALRRPQPASVVLSWDNDMQDMLGGLERARYIETRPAYGDQGPRKSTARFRPDILATTELGGEHLDAISKPGSAAHARRRKTPRELDREIAQSLATRGQPSLATRGQPSLATRGQPSLATRGQPSLATRGQPSLATRGQPQLAELFADPEATQMFAREMRHELQKRQASERTAADLAAR